MRTANGTLTVADVMTERVTSLSPESSVLEAVNLFAECGFRHVLVLDPAGKLAGVLSDRDALRSMARTHDPERTQVASVMARDLVTATPEMALADAIDLLVGRRINCLPVIDAAGGLRGILTTTDLLRAFHDVLRPA